MQCPVAYRCWALADKVTPRNLIDKLPLEFSACLSSKPFSFTSSLLSVQRQCSSSWIVTRNDRNDLRLNLGLSKVL